MTRSHPAWLLLLLTSGCAEGFDTESAFSDERYLCEAASASEWAAAVDACRTAFLSDESCLGVISFQGELQGIPVVVDAELVEVAIENRIRLDLSSTRKAVSMVGFAPYFGFELTVDRVGGVIPATGGPRTLTVGPAPDPDLQYDDSFVEGALRLSAGTDSADVNFGSGSMVVETQEAGEASGSFSFVGFRAGNRIEGCYHAFDPDPDAQMEMP